MSTEKDFDLLPYSLASVRKYVMQPIAKIVLVAPNTQRARELADKQGVDFIDENNILNSPKLKQWFAASGYKINHENFTWYYQQFLKLTYHKLALTDFYHVIDSDVLLNRPVMLTKGGNKPNKIGVTYFVGDNAGYKISTESISKLLNQEIMPDKFSFIADMMCFKKHILASLLEEIEKKHNRPFYEAAIAGEQGNAARFSEFELHGCFTNFIDKNNTYPIYS